MINEWDLYKKGYRPSSVNIAVGKLVEKNITVLNIFGFNLYVRSDGYNIYLSQPEFSESQVCLLSSYSKSLEYSNGASFEEIISASPSIVHS